MNSLWWRRLLAGLETGVVGGVVMLGWLALVSVFISRHSPWIVPNLLAARFFRTSAGAHGFSAATLPGLAIHIVTAGVLGMLFALLVRDAGGRLRVTLAGLLAGLLWRQFSVAFFQAGGGARMMAFAGSAAALSAHLLYGLVLGRYPAALESVRRHWPGGESALSQDGTGAQ